MVRDVKMKLETVWRKSRGRRTTVDLHDGSSLPIATLPPSLTLIPTSLLQTICDEANNRYDKSGEVYVSTTKAAGSLYCGSSIPRAKKETPKMGTQKSELKHWSTTCIEPDTTKPMEWTRSKRKKQEKETNDLEIARGEAQLTSSVIGSLRW